MAAPLRVALVTLAWAAVGAIYLPLIPAALAAIPPLLQPDSWRALLGDAQLPAALLATVVSSAIALLGALAITMCAIAALWPSRRWQRLMGRLPLMLAFPHIAFATAALLLFAEGGALFRLFPGASAPADRYGIGLGALLAVKESAFLLWAAYALLDERGLQQQCLVMRSQGYGRWQCLLWLIAPRLLPQLRIVLLATLAWTLSAVDVAIVIGPGNPPTLAVLAARWLAQGDDGQQAQGALACLLLIIVMAAMALAGRLLWALLRRLTPDFAGLRRPGKANFAGPIVSGLLLPAGLVAFATLLLSARGAWPDEQSLYNSFALGALSALIATPLCLLWLACGPRRSGWVWLPLLLPALPLAAGQYRLALAGWIDGEWLTVLWGHLLWVFPWTLFMLRPAWQRRDPRQLLIARTLGWGRARCFWLVSLPQLARPLLAAFAVGFSVSIAQYLPTLWLGGGRITTLATEAVALSSGGSAPLLAAQALWQTLLPLAVFALAALLMRLIGRYRQGLR